MMGVDNFFYWYGDTISTIAIIFTLIVLIIYTRETYRLRKETAKQTELSLRPFVVIKVFNDRLIYKNIGHSHALDVETEPFDAEVFILKFEKWYLIEAGEANELNLRGEGKATFNKGLISAAPVPKFTPKALAERDSDLELILNIHYKNLEKVAYFTKVKTGRKGIEILSTGKGSK
jgi:hypothetical protein